MIFRLIYLNGAHKGERITITREPMTIGRNPSCAIHLPDDPEIAEQHCTITHGESDELAIRDDGSMSRILLNSHEVKDAKLKHGDTIEVGRTRFLVQAFIQAEVTSAGVPTSQSRSRPIFPLVLIIVLIGLAAFGIHRLREKRKAEAEGAREKEIIPPALFKDIEATSTNEAANPKPPKGTKTAGDPEAPPDNKVEPAEVVPAKPEPTPKPELEPPIIIDGLSQQKFPKKAEYDEMRVATLTLRTTGSVVDDTKVAVKFEFFDRDLSTGEIAPARAIVPTKALQTSQLGRLGEETLTATYTVPKGLRSAPSAKSGMTFYGVRVKVLYAGELVAEKAVPRTLMDGQ